MKHASGYIPVLFSLVGFAALLITIYPGNGWQTVSEGWGRVSRVWASLDTCRVVGLVQTHKKHDAPKLVNVL